MKHPRSEAVFAVADRLQKMVPMALNEGNLSMSSIYAATNLCGMVCCHGGWYGLAAGLPIRTALVPSGLGFIDGAAQMAIDLGFKLQDCPLYRNKKFISPDKQKDYHNDMVVSALIKWASDNEYIWGNSHGILMFSANGSIAFRSPVRKRGAALLQDIVDHWREVGTRLQALEIPEYKDITSELAVLPQEETADTPIKQLI